MANLKDTTIFGDLTINGDLKGGTYYYQVYPTFNVNAANTWQLVYTIKIPANCFYIVNVRGMYANAPCNGVCISQSSSNYKLTYAGIDNTNHTFHYPSCCHAYKTSSEQTLYIWGSWDTATQNAIDLSVLVIKEPQEIDLSV